MIYLYILLFLVALYLLVVAFYYLFQERFIFVPHWKGVNYQNLAISLPYSEHYLDATDGGKIHAIMLHVQDPKGCILYFHGNTGGINRWGALASELAILGYDVFIPDYRGYGKSRGKRSEEIMHNDARMCYKYVCDKGFKDRMIIYGRSLGSGMAVRLAAGVQVLGLILETPFFNLNDPARHVAPFIPAEYLLKYQFRSDLYIPKVQCPILILHGTRDSLVPYRSALKLYHLVSHRPDVEMITITGGKHNNLNKFPLYREKVVQFLTGL